MNKIKAAFVGFGEVNTPVDIIVRKCEKAKSDLENEGIELVSVLPVSDDYEERISKKRWTPCPARASTA